MNLADDLAKLTVLHREGAITDDEFTSAKSRIINAAQTEELTRSAIIETSLTRTSDSNNNIQDNETNERLTSSANEDSKKAPTWMKPWGWFAVWLGAIGFFASTYMNWQSGHEEEGLIRGAMNPLFFVAMPIGLYWLMRSRVFSDFNNSFLTESEKQSRGIKC